LPFLSHAVFLQHVSSANTVIGIPRLSVRLSVTMWYNFSKRRPMIIMWFSTKW